MLPCARGPPPRRSTSSPKQASCSRWRSQRPPQVPRARRRTEQQNTPMKTHLYLLVVLGLASCGPTLQPPNGPPPPPPSEEIVIVGDGALASGHFGPSGGILQLGPPGPSIEIPAGMPEAGGLSVSLEAQSTEGLPDVAGRIG